MRILYYIIQFTWGLPLNIVGALVWLVLKIFCRKMHEEKYRNAICIVVAWNFGGLNLGMFLIRGESCESCCAHEYGHSIQNLWWGPLMPIVITIPSAIRFWWIKAYIKWFYPKTRKALSPYTAIWFERQADVLGLKAETNSWSWL